VGCHRGNASNNNTQRVTVLFQEFTAPSMSIGNTGKMRMRGPADVRMFRCLDVVGGLA